ncbi:DUF2975 domain-containing protein [Micromonospora sp. NPDC050417]|uniref:DUF2975 domain-containing protein n=1 Tax=Micromonospora sp. NPDC050417 TaxID=3364280 RepID=UPI00379FC739
MGKLTVLALRAVIVALLTGSLYLQVVMVASNAVQLDEGLAAGNSPYVVIAIVILGLLTFQVILVCVWRLVTMVKRGTVFSHAAFRYVDIVIGAILAAAVLAAALVIILAPGEGDTPGMLLIMGGVVVAILGAALIVLVLRMLLAQAVARDAQAAHLEAELDEVV